MNVRGLHAWREGRDRRRRFRQIEAALPEAIDLWVLVMQAGLDFQVAVNEYLERGPAGALRDELGLFLMELRLGASRADALRRLRDRTPEPHLQETVRTLLQGIELGAPLTPLLRRQGQALRRQRAIEAEKRAAIAPLKLLFPLFVFIFPTIFIALLGPVYLTASRSALP